LRVFATFIRASPVTHHSTIAGPCAPPVQVELATSPPPRITLLAWHTDREQGEPARVLVDAVRGVCAAL
jgi:hypothetical protein